MLFVTNCLYCPTKDNIRVHVEFGVNFRIGKDPTREEDCRKFLYYCGALKLQELLEEQCEEVVRNFFRTIKINNVRDVKSETTN